MDYDMQAMPPELIEWFLAGPPWMEYCVRLDLLDQSEDDHEVAAARAAMLADPQVKTLIKELNPWPGSTLKRHNDATHALHKLVFLADLGLKANDVSLRSILEQILAHQSEEGAFQIVVNIPTHFGGSGEDEWQWMLCDTPSTLYALIKFGLGDEPRVGNAMSHLASLIRENGWPCAAASELGKFRGPGRASDPCPYANLVALKALAQSPEWRESEACRIGTTTLLDLWDARKDRRPYLFAMGTDFAKLKAPMIWYDLLHVLEVLSQFNWLRGDPRLQELASLLKSQADAQKRFTASSIWMAWKGWEFAQKKEPSRWVSLIAHRALKRLKM